MTCSSSTTCKADPARPHKRATLLAAALALGFAAPGTHVLADQPSSAKLIEDARAAIRKGDGIDAEMKLRAAMERGASRQQVAAYMGEAYLDQGDPAKARRWLGGHEFTPQTAAQGWRALGRLERIDGNLPASGKAYDHALDYTPDDASLWVEIGRLRYAGGQHAMAIEAADHAIALDARSVRALEFRGELVRDRYGLAAAVPWFERALTIDRNDVSVLLAYAATLGELGRNAEMLTLTRRVLQLDRKNPQAFYLQAVMAARAGRYELARGLIVRTRGKLKGEPGMLFLQGVVELAAGNYQAASEYLEALLALRPDNRKAKDVLIRAICLNGQYRYATLRFAGDIARQDASPYLLTRVARAYEILGDRRRAGELLDMAAAPQRAVLRVIPSGNRIGAMLAQGQGHAAEVAAQADADRDPGFYDAQSLAGDVQLVLGRPGAAEIRYADAAQVRMPESLFLRRFEAFAAARDLRGAQTLTDAYLGQNPTNRSALRAAAWLALGTGRIERARAILAWLRDNGGERDVALLSDLAMIDAGSGDPIAASMAARTAYRLQRANPAATQALGYSYATTGGHAREARALFDKARALVGPTPVIAAGLRRLGSAG